MGQQCHSSLEVRTVRMCQELSEPADPYGCFCTPHTPVVYKCVCVLGYLHHSMHEGDAEGKLQCIPTSWYSCLLVVPCKEGGIHQIVDNLGRLFWLLLQCDALWHRHHRGNHLSWHLNNVIEPNSRGMSGPVLSVIKTVTSEVI